MKPTILVFLLLSIINLSCSSDAEQSIETLWINAERVNCEGVGPRTCYQTQTNSVIDEAAWQYFYSPIENFDSQYKTGYRYQITVEKSPVENPPADGSSIRYTLKEINSKTAYQK